MELPIDQSPSSCHGEGCRSSMSEYSGIEYLDDNIAAAAAASSLYDSIPFEEFGIFVMLVSMKFVNVRPLAKFSCCKIFVIK